jgi:hypothetical protein
VSIKTFLIIIPCKMILLIGGQHGSRALCSGEAGVAASEHWLSRSHGIQRMPTVNLN